MKEHYAAAQERLVQAAVDEPSLAKVDKDDEAKVENAGRSERMATVGNSGYPKGKPNGLSTSTVQTSRPPKRGPISLPVVCLRWNAAWRDQQVCRSHRPIDFMTAIVSGSFIVSANARISAARLRQCSGSFTEFRVHCCPFRNFPVYSGKTRVQWENRQTL